MSFEIAKAGWLYRQSTVFKRWKREWFCLYYDGVLRYFESPDSHVAEGAVRMKPDCIEIQAGPQIKEVTPPPGCTAAGLFKVVFNDKSLILCSESPDDMCAWHISLEQARVIEAIQQRHGPTPQHHQGNQVQVVTTHRRYPVQPTAYSYPGQTVVTSNPPTYVIQSPNGDTTTIVYTDQGPRYYRGYYDGCGAGTGFLAGAALGSLMFWPLLWW